MRANRITGAISASDLGSVLLAHFDRAQIGQANQHAWRISGRSGRTPAAAPRARRHVPRSSHRLFVERALHGRIGREMISHSLVSIGSAYTDLELLHACRDWLDRGGW